jgi:hypothetical protein
MTWLRKLTCGRGPLTVEASDSNAVSEAKATHFDGEPIAMHFQRLFSCLRHPASVGVLGC